MRTLGLLILVSSCVCTAARADTPAPRVETQDPFDECKLTVATGEGWQEWKADCTAGWILTSIDTLAAVPVKPFTDEIIDGLHKISGGDVQRDTPPLKLDGGSWSIARFRTAAPHASDPSLGLLATIVRPQGRRILWCIGAAATESRCSRAFQTIATRAWHSGPPSPAGSAAKSAPHP